MPKLRQARTKEEAAQVPLDQQIEIHLTDGSESPPPEPVKPGEPPAAEKPPAIVEPPKDDEVASLKAQLAQIQNAEKTARDGQAAAEAQARTLAQERDQARRQSTQHGQEAEEAKYVAILNALTAAEAEAQAANREWEAAEVSGDQTAKSQANRKMAKAEAAIARHEEAKDSYEAAKETRKNNPPVETRTEDPNPVERAIANLPEGAKGWLRSHPEYITDVRKNAKLQAMHWDVMDEGHPQFSNQYFESLESHLGLRQKPVIETEDDPPPPPRSRIVPSAPPTRESISTSTGKPSSSKIVLTPEQRDAARISGVDEITYARGVQELEARKRQGMYNERG